MLRRLTLGLVICATPMTAIAEQAPTMLAEYYTNPGTIPPEYYWTTSVIIYPDGELTLTHCRGYISNDASCTTLTATVPAPAMEAIRNAAIDSGLAETPAEELDDPPVGGSAANGAVHLDGWKIDLPAYPETADADRVAAVLRAIEAAIPQDLRPALTGD